MERYTDAVVIKKLTAMESQAKICHMALKEIYTLVVCSFRLFYHTGIENKFRFIPSSDVLEFGGGCGALS